jgi:hypothetical protein
VEAFDNTAEKATAADSQHDNSGAHACGGHLIDDGCVACPNQGIIERRNISRGFLLRHLRSVSVGIIPGGAMLNDRSAFSAYDFTHPRWCRSGHKDHHLHAEHASGIGDGIPRIATGGSNEALGPSLMVDLAGITDAANLEGSYGLESFHLQVNRVTEG